MHKETQDRSKLEGLSMLLTLLSLILCLILFLHLIMTSFSFDLYENDVAAGDTEIFKVSEPILLQITAPKDGELGSWVIETAEGKRLTLEIDWDFIPSARVGKELESVTYYKSGNTLKLKNFRR